MFPRIAFLILGCVTLSFPGRCFSVEETEQERRSRVEKLSDSEKKQLRTRLELFNRLPFSQQDQMRELDQALQRASDREMLEGIMLRFHAWFSGLSEADKEKFRAFTSDQQRIEFIEQKFSLAKSEQQRQEDLKKAADAREKEQLAAAERKKKEETEAADELRKKELALKEENARRLRSIEEKLSSPPPRPPHLTLEEMAKQWDEFADQLSPEENEIVFDEIKQMLGEKKLSDFPFLAGEAMKRMERIADEPRKVAIIAWLTFMKRTSFENGPNDPHKIVPLLTPASRAKLDSIDDPEFRHAVFQFWVLNALWKKAFPEMTREKLDEFLAKTPMLKAKADRLPLHEREREIRQWYTIQYFAFQRPAEWTDRNDMRGRGGEGKGFEPKNGDKRGPRGPFGFPGFPPGPPPDEPPPR